MRKIIKGYGRLGDYMTVGYRLINPILGPTNDNIEIVKGKIVTKWNDGTVEVEYTP